MNKSLLRKTTVTVTLLAILALTIVPANMLLAKADPIGVGKFLTVEIDGQGYVTATKVKSGEFWEYYPTTPPTENKLGAGTVSLEAFASEGWEFSHWEEDLTGIANPIDYKSEKYGYVRAVFLKKTFTITATVATEASNGYIVTIIDTTPTQITGQLDVTVEYGESQMFTFYPDAENHVSAIQVDNGFEPYALSYTFNYVQADHAITVFFSADGEAYVPAGNNVPVYLGGSVSLNFDSTQGGGSATQQEVDLHPLLVGTSLILWDVNTGVSFTGVVEIALPYIGTQEITQVFTGDSLDALYSDVNADGVVNGTDVSDVANGIKTTSRSGAEYDAQWDVNRDGELTEDDVHVVNANKGTILESLNFWVIEGILYIETDHFSIFRGR
jgi:fibronectin type 3 domain-containing protein